MEPRHARYPFLASAREAVREADVDLAELATAGQGPVLTRAVERVRNAIEAGVVGDPHPTPRVELLSYPLARVLVSLIDQSGLTRRYTGAEATTAYERLTADIEDETELKSVSSPGITLEALLAEFDLQTAIRQRQTPGRGSADGFDVDVGTYLRLAGGFDANRWRLVNRPVAAGQVPVTRGELYELLREAVRRRVAEGLPLDVPDEIRDSLTDQVADLKAELAEHDISRDIDAVVPDLFPPCITALLDRASAEPLPDHSRFSLVTFLAAIGMPVDEIVDHLPHEDDELTSRQIALVSDEEGGVYPPPSCATMQAYGDCVDMDALCERIGHPLEYYERRLDGDDPADYASRPESQ